MRVTGLAREAPVFVVVGLAATACHYVTALAAHRFLGLEPMSATLCGYLASVGVSYLGNSRFTFRRPALHGPQFARFVSVSLAGLAVNEGVIFAASRIFGLPMREALIPVVIVVPAFTFVLSKFWAFRVAVAEGAG
ncbi:MAG: GtrA family protein [Caulobacteraceae bacterium]